jgi:hypothetical protein
MRKIINSYNELECKPEGKRPVMSCYDIIKIDLVSDMRMRTGFVSRVSNVDDKQNKDGLSELQRLVVQEAAKVAQAVQCLTTDWMTGRSGFDPRQMQRIFSSSLCVHTGSEAHPASCTMGTGGPFPGANRGRGVTLTTHPI